VKKQVVNAALTDTWAQQFVRDVQAAVEAKRLGVVVDVKRVRIVGKS
jgi:hypothetical protein